MKAPLLLSALLVAGLTFTHCKKDDPKPEPTPTPTPKPTPTPTPTPFTQGFKIQDQVGTSFIADSAKIHNGVSVSELIAYKGVIAGDPADHVHILVTESPLTQKTYSVSSIDKTSTRVCFIDFYDSYDPVAGQLVVTAINASVASATFQFTVTPSSSSRTSTTTVLSGTFLNVPIRN